jgi:hypothetical protein
MSHGHVGDADILTKRVAGRTGRLLVCLGHGQVAHLNAWDCCLCVKVVVHRIPNVVRRAHQHSALAQSLDGFPVRRTVEVPAAHRTDADVDFKQRPWCAAAPHAPWHQLL